MTEKFYVSQDVQKFLDRISQKQTKPLFKMTPESAREFLSDIQGNNRIELETEIEDLTIPTELAGNVKVRCVRPKNVKDKLPAIIYAHGGGWVMGDEYIFNRLIKQIAIEANAALFFINYTRAPEAKYPTALNQIYGVMDYVYYHPDEFNLISKKIVIAGDSAGANMVASTMLMSKFAHGPEILAQILFYPVTDASMSTKSYKTFQNGPWLTQKAMEYFFDAYLPDERLKSDKYVSPLKASIDDLKGLPPTIIFTVENDVLRDEGEGFARKLATAGIDVINFRVNGTIHDFLMLNDLANSPQTKAVLTSACAIIKEIFKNK